MGHNLLGRNSSALEVFGGLVSLAGAQSIPSGSSPLTYDTDFTVGGVGSRQGLVSEFSFAQSADTHGGSVAVSATWANPTGILIDDQTAAYLGGFAGPLGPNSALDVTGFGFNLPAGTVVLGVTVTLKGYSDSQANVTAQLLANGVLIGQQQQAPLAPVTIFGGPSDLFGSTLASVNSVQFGVRFTANSSFFAAAAYLQYVSITVYHSQTQSNFTYIKTFQTTDGGVKTLALDTSGTLWIEDALGNPKVFSLLEDGLTPNSYARSVTLDDREYVCFSNGKTGTDLPRQFNNRWLDRVSQVGPGAAPVFTPLFSTTASYGIQTITQPAARSWGFAFGLQSSGPGSSSPGNVVTQYYADSTVTGQDQDLVSAFNSGKPLYLAVAGTTALVTSIGLGKPPGQARNFYYFTYAVAGSAYSFQKGQNGYSVSYQRTVATLVTTVPVPLVTVGSKVVITATSVAAYNATWPISAVLNSGSMAITQTAVTGGTATYSFQVSSGANPTAGQLVTITNTLNANGVLNGPSLTIVSVIGSSVGTFTVGGFPATNFPAQSEQGQATTAGTRFEFEPGLNTLGTSNSPIYGSSSGGSLVLEGSGQTIGSGIRQAVLIFITRNGAYTAPSPPITFTTPDNTNTIYVSQLLLGPPDVIGRAVAFTEAGQNGVPGANFFVIPLPVPYTVNGIKYVASATVINNNVDTSASFTFTDQVLLNAEAIDIQGNNLFQQIELGNPAWCVAYASRMFYGLCQSKVPNFNNLSFDGGYLPVIGGMPVPSGWTVGTGQLLISPIFGNSYYIQDATGAPTAGLIQQNAYQDFYRAPILRRKTAYSVRVTARAPSGSQQGNLVVDLYDGAMVRGVFSLPLASMSASFQTYSGVLSAEIETIPEKLVLRAYAQGINGDVEIDRIEPFPTRHPIETTALYGSYVNNFDAFDQDFSVLDTASENQQPCNGAAVMNDVLYLLKESSLYYTQDSPGEEPGAWTIHEVSNRVGACGINAYDSGEQWIITACRNGLYVFSGGEPGRITKEIAEVWNAIHWSAGATIAVKNDGSNRRMLIAVPMVTPNQWLPDAAVNADPRTPNVIFMCNYAGVDSGGELEQAASIQISGFAGTLQTHDMRRKWSLWQIPTPYMELIQRGDTLDKELLLCNGIQSSKIYSLGGTTDDGRAIHSRYVTYGWTDDANQAMGLHRKSFALIQALATGAGNLAVQFFPNQLTNTPYVLSGGMELGQGNEDVIRSINVQGQRVFVDFQANDVKTNWDVSRVVLVGAQSPWSPI